VSDPLFEIDDLHARPLAPDADAPAEILQGVDLRIEPGEIHALMGPNGSGKSTLANVLVGSPEYEVTHGSIRFNGDDITTWTPDVRGKAGIFLAFQYPQEIAGVSVINFLRQALSSRKGIDLSVLELRLAIMEWMERLDMDPSFADRYLNEGFSGGEQEVRSERPELGILAITHYQRLLKYLEPDRVHILVDGRIVDSGGPELAERLETEGYDAWR